MDVGSEAGDVTGEVAGVGVCDGVRAGIVVADWSLSKIGLFKMGCSIFRVCKLGWSKKAGVDRTGRGAVNFLGFHSLLETAFPPLQW
jgi:hypothetical protein